jgi:hypothetical protein
MEYMKLPATEKSIREIPGEVNSEIIPQMISK